MDDDPILITILRAGLAMHNGLLHTFDRCESAFVSAYRSHTSKEEFSIEVEYLAAPNLDERVWIISDPMLASGNSMVEVYKALLKFGKPKKVIVIVSIVPSDFKLAIAFACFLGSLVGADISISGTWK